MRFLCSMASLVRLCLPAATVSVQGEPALDSATKLLAFASSLHPPLRPQSLSCKISSDHIVINCVQKKRESQCHCLQKLLSRSSPAKTLQHANLKPALHNWDGEGAASARTATGLVLHHKLPQPSHNMSQQCLECFFAASSDFFML